MNCLADLAELDHELRRIGRNHEDVRVRLDEDARFAFVGFAKIFAGGHGFVDERFEVCRLGDARAVRADAAEIGQAVSFDGVEAVDGLGEHERERVFARAAGPSEDERVRKSARAQTFAQVRDGGGIAQEILEAHGMRVAVSGGP